MKVVFGLFVAVLALWGAASHLDQSLFLFWDLVAFLMVIMGTISVAIITLPIIKINIIVREIFSSLSSYNKRREKAVTNSMEVLNGRSPKDNPKRIDEKILKDGIELTQLGIDSNKIEEILVERVYNYSNDCRSIANWLISLSKYPPAFGLAGTILGLTNLMRGLAEGSDPKQTGMSMAIALIATLYGVLFSNLVINPLGERLKANVQENEVLCEISIRTISMLNDKTNLLEAQEYLGAYVAMNNKKINVLNNYLNAS